MGHNYPEDYRKQPMSLIHCPMPRGRKHKAETGQFWKSLCPDRCPSCPHILIWTQTSTLCIAITVTAVGMPPPQQHNFPTSRDFNLRTSTRINSKWCRTVEGSEGRAAEPHTPPVRHCVLSSQPIAAERAAWLASTGVSWQHETDGVGGDSSGCVGMHNICVVA